MRFEDHQTTGTDDSGYTTEIGELIVNFTGKMFAQIIFHIFKGFFLTTGGLLAWAAFQAVAKHYGG
jgi:hypothetical protein